MLDRANQKGGSSISKTFMRRLVWRDLSYWLLHHWPHMPSEPMRPHYADQVLPVSATVVLDADISMSVAAHVHLDDVCPSPITRRPARKLLTYCCLSPLQLMVNEITSAGVAR